MATDSFLVFVKPAEGGLNMPGGPIAPAGETKDQAFAPLKAIELSSFEFSSENPTTIGSVSAGAGAGKAKFQPLTITKPVDRASPHLFAASVSGMHFPQVDLYVRKAGGVPTGGGATGHAYLTYTFRMVFVTNVTWSGGGTDTPEETVEFVYGALGLSYYQQNPDGTLMSQPLTEQWSQVQNNPTLNVTG